MLTAELQQTAIAFTKERNTLKDNLNTLEVSLSTLEDNLNVVHHKCNSLAIERDNLQGRFGGSQCIPPPSCSRQLIPPGCHQGPPD